MTVKFLLQYCYWKWQYNLYFSTVTDSDNNSFYFNIITESDSKVSTSILLLKVTVQPLLQYCYWQWQYSLYFSTITDSDNTASTSILLLTVECAVDVGCGLRYGETTVL